MEATSANTSDMNRLKEHITKLPQELQDLILDKVFEAVFVPEEVVPHHTIGRINQDCFVDGNEQVSYKYALRSLDNALYQKYKNRYWSNNTWVSPEHDIVLASK